jgi:mannitol-1-phosphate 5-dehydrogenase
MNLIKSKYQVDVRKIVIFGAGKIGRSFIGQLFGRGGYKVVFVDVDPVIVARLNSQGNYRVIIKGEKDEEIIVRNVQAISAVNMQEVIEAVSTAGILAVSVGRNALEKVIPVIAAGLELRYNKNFSCPLDIIIAENMRAAGDFMKEQLIKNLPLEYPIEKLVGLVETSIGKMVPIMTLAELEKDPLMVYAEPYNALILDGKGFKSPIPDIKGLAPKNNIKAWVDRKAFIHNLGHATAAYYGYYQHPEAVYMYEVLDDSKVFRFTRDVMLQSADILRTAYPDDFTASDLEDHIDDLIFRFRNKALRDTIFRVGQDLIRKLSANDRFMGSIHLAMQYRMPYDMILKAMTFGLCFTAKNEAGNSFPSDITFLSSLEKDFELTLIELLGYDPVLDLPVIEKLKELYKVQFKKFSNLPDHSPGCV